MDWFVSQQVQNDDGGWANDPEIHPAGPSQRPCDAIVFLLKFFPCFSLDFFSCSYLRALFLFLRFLPPQSSFKHFLFAVR